MPRKKTATEKEKQKINEVVEVVQEASKELMLKKRDRNTLKNARKSFYRNWKNTKS